MQVAQAGRPGDPREREQDIFLKIFQKFACAGSGWELGPPCRVFENLPKICLCEQRFALSKFASA